MNEERRVFSNYLKKLNKASLRKLCEITGLSEEESKLITMYYGDGKTETFIADIFGMSANTYHNAKMKQLDRMRNYFHMHLFRPEVTAIKDRLRMIDEMLYKKCGN